MTRSRPQEEESGIDRPELDQALARGVAWMGAVRWLAQLLSWGSTLIVARILVPGDFGLVGMATLYLGLATVVSEAGLGSAVVNLRWMDRSQIAQLNTVAVAIGLGAFAASLALARPVGWFFEEPELPRVIVAMSVIYLVNGLKPIPLGLLEKALRYRALGLVEATKAIIGSSTTLVMAWLGYGYWSLVGGFVSGQVASTVCVLTLSRHGFGLPRRESLAEAARFSADVLGSRIGWFIYSKSDFLIAGKVLGTVPLGLYSLAWTLAQAPLDKIIAVVTRVMPGIFARVQDRPPEIRRYLGMVAGAIPIVMIPFAWGVALVAPTAVPYVLGPQWTGMVVPLQILCVYMSYRAVSPLFSQLLVSVGDTRFQLRISMVSLLVLPPAFLVASRWGPVGIATAWLVVHPVITFWAMRRALGHAEMTMGQLVRAVAPGPVAGLCMVVAVLAVQIWLRPDGELLRLTTDVGVGAVAYLGSLWLLFPKHVRRFFSAARLVRG